MLLVLVASILCLSPLPVQSETCPTSWASEQNYPHICYHNTGSNASYIEATNICRQKNEKATLPVFHDLSEYISYSKWANANFPNLCSEKAWLGLEYNSTADNYTWVDGTSDFGFGINKFIRHESLTFAHSVVGSDDWEATFKNEGHRTVCQLRLNKTGTTTVSLAYPTNPKCPQTENWFYDEESDICYFYERYLQKNWTTASAFCKTIVGRTLPYFKTENEFNSFVKLTKTIHVPCDAFLWLGYSAEQGSPYKDENETTSSFLKWAQWEPIDYPRKNIVGCSPKRNAMANSFGLNDSINFLCQCRPGKCES